MNKQEYIEFHENFCEKMKQITASKNHDYTGAKNDPFSNFRQIENLIGENLSMDIVAIGFLTRMSDKFSRIGSFISQGQLLVKDESVHDTLMDLANYCILFDGYLRDREEKLCAASKQDQV